MAASFAPARISKLMSRVSAATQAILARSGEGLLTRLWRIVDEPLRIEGIGGHTLPLSAHTRLLNVITIPAGLFLTSEQGVIQAPVAMDADAGLDADTAPTLEGGLFPINPIATGGASSIRIPGIPTLIPAPTPPKMRPKTPIRANTDWADEEAKKQRNAPPDAPADIENLMTELSTDHQAAILAKMKARGAEAVSDEDAADIMARAAGVKATAPRPVHLISGGIVGVKAAPVEPEPVEDEPEVRVWRWRH